MKTGTFPSSSGHEIHTWTLHDDGRLTCTCRGFRTPSKCWHVKKVAVDEGLNIAIGGELFEDLYTGAEKLENKPPAQRLNRTDDERNRDHQVILGQVVGHVVVRMNECFVPVMCASALPEEHTIKNYVDRPGWVMEIKYNGHRLIVCKKANGLIMAWARSGIVRQLPPHLLNMLFQLPPGTYDGELYVPGGTSTDVTALKLQHKLQITFFDMLKVGNESCMDRPAEYRRELLIMACSKLCGQDVTVAPQFPVSEAGLNTVWANGGEGVILKAPGIKYQPGKRIKEWVKFKKSQSAVVTITGFKQGLLGPHSIILGVDAKGIDVKVKSLNDDWRAMFEREGSEKYIGQKLVISYQEKTVKGKYQHPMADHLLLEEDK